MTDQPRCVRCGHAFAAHVPELRPGYRACASGTCVCDDLVKPLHLTQTGPPARMPLGRPGSAGLLSDPPGGPSTELRPTEAIRAARERYLTPEQYAGAARTHVPVAEVVIYQHAKGSGKTAALNVAYIEAAAAGVHVHEYGPGGLARSDNCPRGCHD